MLSARGFVIMFSFIGAIGWASEAQASVCSPKPFSWIENFEASGYDQIYSEPSLAQPSNDIWPDAPTSLFDGSPLLEVPATWGSEFLLISIGESDGGAVSRVELGQPIIKLFSHIEFIVIENSMEVGGSLTLAIAKDAGGPSEIWPIAWSVHLVQRDQIEIEARIAGSQRIHTVAVSEGSFHSVEVWYGLNREYKVFLDGNLFGSGPILASYPQEIWWLVVGNSGSQSGRNIAFAIDNFRNVGVACAQSELESRAPKPQRLGGRVTN